MVPVKVFLYLQFANGDVHRNSHWSSEMNRSKSRAGSRFWSIWAKSGAVDYTAMARSMGLAIFGYDPIIGCPFDNSAMNIVDEVGAYKVGRRVTFRGPNKLGTMEFPTIRGKIIAIGNNAKYLNGKPFVALAVQVGSGIYIKHGGDVQVL